MQLSKATQEAADLKKRLDAAEVRVKQMEAVAKTLAETERERDLLRDKVREGKSKRGGGMPCQVRSTPQNNATLFSEETGIKQYTAKQYTPGSSPRHPPPHSHPQVQGLQRSSDETASLRVTIKELELRVSELVSTRERLQEAEAARERAEAARVRAEAEAARTANMLSNLEARLQVRGS